MYPIARAVLQTIASHWPGEALLVTGIPIDTSVKPTMSPAAHIAGIGIAHISRSETLDDLAIAAGTKALLDAGVTYSSVDQSIACFLEDRYRIDRRCLSVFGMEGAPVCDVNNTAGLFTAVQYVRSGQSNCVLVVGIDQVSNDIGEKWEVELGLTLPS